MSVAGEDTYVGDNAKRLLAQGRYFTASNSVLLDSFQTESPPVICMQSSTALDAPAGSTLLCGTTPVLSGTVVAKNGSTSVYGDTRV